MFFQHTQPKTSIFEDIGNYKFSEHLKKKSFNSLETKIKDVKSLGQLIFEKDSSNKILLSRKRINDILLDLDEASLTESIQKLEQQLAVTSQKLHQRSFVKYLVKYFNSETIRLKLEIKDIKNKIDKKRSLLNFRSNTIHLIKSAEAYLNKYPITFTHVEGSVLMGKINNYLNNLSMARDKQKKDNSFVLFKLYNRN